MKGEEKEEERKEKGEGHRETETKRPRDKDILRDKVCNKERETESQILQRCNGETKDRRQRLG